MIDALIERYSSAKSRRANADATMQEIGKYVWPSAQDVLQPIATNEGLVRTTLQYTATARMAARTLAAGLVSYLMPAGTKWFEYTPTDQRLTEDTMVAKELAQATDAVHRELWRSNFWREIFTTIRSMVVFGTGCISIEWDDGFNFRCYNIGDIYFEENSKGKVDVVFRRIQWTARQCKQEFGEDKLSKAMNDALKDNKHPNDTFEVIHCVLPNSEYSDKQIGSKKFASYYIAASEKHLLKRSGYDYLPYKIARFERIPNELTGRGPGHDLLPEIKMEDAMRETFILASEMQCQPPCFAEDGAVIGQIDMSPSAVNNMMPGRQMPQFIEIKANPMLNDVMLKDQEQKIKDAYFNDLFRVLADYRNMTATEVQGRLAEGLALVAPVVTGTQKELQDPLMMDALNLMVEAGRIDLSIEDVDLAYSGRLALAMSSMQASAATAFIATWAPLHTLFPVLDNLDLDGLARHGAITEGIAATYVRDPDDVAQMRAERQQTEQMQQFAETGKTASEALRNVASTPMGAQMLGM
jgi:hypothetical protein